MKDKVIAVIGVFFLIVISAVALRADDEMQPGVARVSLIHGDVSMQRGDSGDWVATSINTPLVAGDWLLTGTKSRTEVQLDYANVLRLSEESEAKIADLSRNKIQVQVRKGLINFDVFKGTEADVEIDTPNMAVRPVGEGQYRILVISDEETQVIVRKGEADVTTPQGSTTVKKGDMITVRGRDNPEYKVAEAPDKDSWDNWNKERDSALADARSYERTNRYYTGASDLDGYGRWVYIADYGWVWSPAAGPGWAPYRDGRWLWEPYWGWTWVSYEPWGWAPYHYGRWFIHAGSWCWWPGPVYPYYRPIWAPAYVSFFGWGHHAGFSIGFGFGWGNIGWLPIGPRDYYYPWWGRYRHNVNVVNITNITNVRNVRVVNGAIGPLHRGRGASNMDGVLTDARIRRGMTSMSGNDFGRVAVPRTGRPVITNADLRQSQVVTGNLPVVPTRESLRPVDRPASRPTITRGPGSDRFFTRSQPTFKPQSFNSEAAQVRDAIQQRGNRPSGPDARPGLRTGESNRAADMPGGRAGAPNDNPSRSARDAAEQTHGTQASTPNAREDRPGWTRFGDRSRTPSDRGSDQTPAERRGEPQNRPRTRDNTPSGRGVDREPARSPAREGTPDASGQRPRTSDSSGGDRSFHPFTPQPGRDRPSRSDGSGRGVDREPARGPGREVTPDTSGQRPRTGGSSGEDRGFHPFTPQPERDRTPRSDSMGGDRSGPGRMPDRGMGGDRPSGPSRAPDSAGRQSGDRPRGSARPPLEMRPRIVEPRAPSSHQGGGSRSTPPPSRQSGGGRDGGGGGHGSGRPPGGGRNR